MISGTPYANQNLSIEGILKNAETRIAAHIDSLKNTFENGYFARTDTPLKEQQAFAAVRVESIKKLLKTEGFDSPDYSKIMELTQDILMKAPDTQFAQMAHWNIHTYWLIYENPWEARDALITYLDKYETDEFMKKEAYDKLSNFAADEREWDAALYYSEKYLAIEPDSYPRLLNKARALVNLGFLEEGRALLLRIVEEDPDSVQANLAALSLDELETAKFNPDLVAAYKKTVEIMRQISMAVENYHLNHMKYPQSIKDLFPDFLEELTDKDAWGHDIIFKFDPDSERFLVASPGSDGRFEGFAQEGLYIDLPGKDIIFADGYPVFSPRIRNP